jgi:small-conductance mechanosensitive channel
MDAIRDFLTELRDYATWAPDWVISIVVLALTALVALSIHRTIIRIARRLLRDRHPYVRSFLTATMPITRLTLLVVALFIVLPAVPINPDLEVVIAKILLLTAIVLIGWAAITAVDMAADLYLMRFRLDVADNLLARKHLTQVRVLTRTVDTVLIIATVGAALMTFDAVRHYGVSLFASAGVAGLIAGLAARPLLSNLFAGIQIAVTQPMRIDDGVLVEGEYGRVEEITSTYVVIRLWDLRRLIVPLAYFIEKPFQNWTRDSTSLVGAVSLHVDYTAPVERIREKAIELVKASPLWDGQTAKLQVIEARENSLELRVTMSARTSSDAFELRCDVREKLVDFLQREFPNALPHARAETVGPSRPGAAQATPAKQDQPTSAPAP